MDLTEHLTCTGGAELPAGVLGGSPLGLISPHGTGACHPLPSPSPASASRAPEWGHSAWAKGGERCLLPA